MAKFLCLIAAVVALLALAEATNRYTIITTVEQGQGQGGRQQPSERCREQIDRQASKLDTCAGLMFEQGSQGKEECCETLRSINDQQCRCEAISEVVSWMLAGPRGERWGSQEMQGKIVGRARNLPRQCNFQHECQIQTVVF